MSRLEQLPLLPTTVVGSYPQPSWLIDRSQLVKVPRVRVPQAWGVEDAHLGEAQEAGTIVAIHEQERSGVDIVTDGEVRRESYSNYFVNALEGIAEEDGIVEVMNGDKRVQVAVPSFDAEIRRREAVEVDNVRFLLAHA